MYIQITENCPKNKIKIFYYMFSNYEEKYGLLNHAINILLNATENVEKEEKGEVFSVLISKTAKYFGITKTRNIFNKALDVLDSEQVVEIGLKYATIEMKLGEIARARAIYVHLSQFCNPNQEEYINDFWNIWEKFEISHGNVETYQEMESIKRNVKSKFSLNVPMFSSNFKG
jgi:pre-mRNA-splicing factor SYF1